MKTNRQFRTITELLQHTCTEQDQWLLFVEEEKKDGLRVTFRRWKQDLLETAGKFSRLEAKYIGMVCDLSYGCILCMYAAIVAGKVLVPLEPDQTGESLDRYVQKADIDLLLYHRDRVEGKASGCECVEFSEFLSTFAPGLTQWPTWEEDRDACIFFTSGTEGEPRGVVLTQKNLAYITSYNSLNKTGRPARMLLYLPVHHVFSFHTLTTCIHDGNEIHLCGSIKYFSRQLQKVKPDALTTVPMVNEMLRNAVQKGIAASGKAEQIAGLIKLSNFTRKLGLDLRNPLFRRLRDSLGGIPQLLITGGSAESAETIRFFDEIGIVILQAYGMSETFGTISTNSLEQNRPGSVGHVHDFIQVRIVDSEIQVRGGNVMKEYYKEPLATRQAFDDGWLRTGDLGYFDRDGYLFLTGRRKNLIILASGENVSPEELEKELLKCSAVAEVVVSERNGRIHGEIFGSREYDGDLKQTVGQAVDRLNRQNPTYKRIVSWELRDTPFEKTSSTKIRR